MKPSCLKSLVLCSLIICAFTGAGARALAQAKSSVVAVSTAPRVFLLDGKRLATVRQRIQDGDPNLWEAYKALLRDATALLDDRLVSVMDKKTVPPSSDKHDYMSQAPYFWPDPAVSNGLPYIRRDGERNPEISRLPDHANILGMPEKVQTLALAWYFSSDERYAEKAVAFLRAWFLDPATRMNPNFKYAQGIPGLCTGRGIGLIEARGLTQVVDAAGLLQGARSWTKENQEDLRRWFEQFLKWMIESEYGRDESAAKNNHGTYYDLQVASFALFLDNREFASNTLMQARQKRIAVQVEPDGRQPLELVRTKAWSYSCGNLAGLMTLATIGERVGVDLWHFETSDGRSISKAVDYLMPFGLGQKQWSHAQLGGWSGNGFSSLLRKAARGMGGNYAEAASKLPALQAADRNFLLWPDLPDSFASRADREVLNFNPGWRFIKADPPGAAAPEYDARSWSEVSAPHTFNDADTFDNWSLTGHRGEQDQWSGRTWYRKTFTAAPSMKGKRVFIEFEAVRQVAEVYLNGKLLGVCKTGFTPFGFDLTPHLRFDGSNVLAVMCDNRFMKDPWVADEDPADGNSKNKESRRKLSELAAMFNAEIPEGLSELRADQIPWNNPHWHPAHGGIYRNVYLHITDPLHISLPLYSFLETDGPYAYATSISTTGAAVTAEVPVENGRSSQENVQLFVRILDANGRKISEMRQSATIDAGSRKRFTVSTVIANPSLWEPASPYLYSVVCSVQVRGESVDSTTIPLGLRTAHWDVKTGLQLNGRHLKLHGWGQKPTQEWPGLGAAIPDWMHFLTLQMMHEAGGNMIRWGHCAGPPAGVAAANRLGFVTLMPGVDGESDTRGAAWRLRSSAFRDTIIYYRNNPSILIWEGGNQKVSREHAAELHGWMEKYDPHGGRAYAHRRADAVTAEFMDVCLGTEGGREITRLPVVEAEYNREESPRRVWDDESPPNFGYPEAKGQTYQLTSEQYAVNQVFQYVSKLGAEDHAGGANWIFSDSTSGGRVACEVARASGEVDAVRLPKEAYYVCRAMFRTDPQVHIVGHWTYPAGTKKTVYVASNLKEVELFANGRSLGRTVATNRFLFVFPGVEWAPGELKAVAYLDGRAVISQVKRTAGKPVALRLSSLMGPSGLVADGADVALIDIEAVDAAGERCPTFQQPARFELEGPAQWIGGYQSGRTNTIHKRELDLECGINRVAIRASSTPGRIIVRAHCDGLPAGEITLISKRPGMTVVEPPS